MLFITDTTTASANTERMFASEYLTATTGAKHPDTHYNETLPIPFPMQSQKEEMIVTDSNNNERGVAIGNTEEKEVTTDSSNMIQQKHQINLQEEKYGKKLYLQQQEQKRSSLKQHVPELHSKLKLSNKAMSSSQGNVSFKSIHKLNVYTNA